MMTSFKALMEGRLSHTNWTNYKWPIGAGLVRQLRLRRCERSHKGDNDTLFCPRLPSFHFSKFQRIGSGAQVVKNVQCNNEMLRTSHCSIIFIAHFPRHTLRKYGKRHQILTSFWLKMYNHFHDPKKIGWISLIFGMMQVCA